MMELNKLTTAQQQFFEDQGYLLDLPAIFLGEEAKRMQRGYEQVISLLQGDENPSDIMGWHKTSRFLYDICAHPQILSCVEGVLGKDFYLAATEFITKSPHSDKIVPWHQDSYYWSTALNNTVTVWLAITDVDEANGAMQVIPGTHKAGLIQHKIAGEDAILSFELDQGTFSEKDAVSMIIPAGGISMHVDSLIHGSGPNNSERWRIGFVIRYSKTTVRWDPQIYPNFEIFMMQGIDEFGYHPQGEVPVEPFGRPPYTKRIRKRE
ncbi:phytanoyl-CoA dioxygenase family protein [Paenibacillus qinlingensis]|uniref:Ectoine hydroxylase-related dioxygenase (Phytanoyl-CoA dioxygenase family) n=1 Tax=Paenibacillus qinlingensis TaxID=1837343 RepID=A0ABU1NSL9_9BACL|nr:phytanoyl-CoA dioxygenase family protein [Paenibacillus qinlingensis]MDR6550481.1 ectoine hydroxylase-related dioxygenase (phytanoyl-CoA dioxygenase family) [Paenibacillus qinlingensis]